MRPEDNPWLSGNENPSTQEWQAQRAQWQEPYSPPAQGQYADGEPARSKTPIILALAALAVIFIGGAAGAGWYLGAANDAGERTRSDVTAASSSAAASSTVASSTAATSSAETSSAAPEPRRNYTTARPGSSVTSQAFAGAVGSAFFSAYAASQSPNITVDAYSPVTGRWYTMSCRESGSTVTCTGGDNAVVIIS